MLKLTLFSLQIILTVVCGVALRPHPLSLSLDTLHSSFSKHLVKRSNPSDAALTSAKKEEILSNIEEVKSDAETTKAQIKEEEKEVEKTKKIVETEGVPTEKEKNDMKNIVEAEKAIALSSAEKNLIDSASSTLNNAEVNEKIAEKLPDEKEKETVASLTEEDDAKTESLLSRAEALRKSTMDSISKATKSLLGAASL